jgi:hypothetical protein
MSKKIITFRCPIRDREPNGTEIIVYEGFVLDAQSSRAHDLNSKLVSPHKIVTKKRKLYVSIDYPLHNPTVFQLTTRNPRGFTRRKLALNIQKAYRLVYNDEERFGSQGHSLNQLTLMDAKISGNRVTLGVDS